MKKVLLAGTALLGAALISSPAAAELNTDLGGYFRGYGVFSDNDDAFAAGADEREFDLRRDSEIHFNGEATTDNGLTVGAHYEAILGGGLETDEAYMYLSGAYGRLNLGSEDGAAYLLQVAAPSADSNVDGLRTQIQQLASPNLAVPFGLGTPAGYTGQLGLGYGTSVATTARTLDYAHADFEDTDRLTYLTPKWNGFQAGLSYAPEAGQDVAGQNVNAPTAAALDSFENLWEAAARWDGEFEGFGISFGAGYSTADLELDGTAVNNYGDDIETWNAGLNVAFQGFSIGAGYLSTDTSEVTAIGPVVDTDVEVDTWVIGAAWDNGPYHVGLSYLDQQAEEGAAEIEADRWTLGAGYTYGPGMSFRGAVAMGNTDDGTAANDDDFTQVTVGTDIQF